MAISFSVQQPTHAPAALPHCSHGRMHFGLDRAYCPDCKQDFTPKTPEYKALLNEASTAMVAQALAKECLKANFKESLSEATLLPGQALMSLNANCRDSDATITEAATEQTDSDTREFCSVATPNNAATEQFHHWVKPYCPSNRKDHTYYRYTWMEGRKLRHIHIKGGNTKSALAIARASQVEAAITDGKSPAQIEQMIESFIEPTS